MPNVPKPAYKVEEVAVFDLERFALEAVWELSAAQNPTFFSTIFVSPDSFLYAFDEQSSILYKYKLP
jgi:hypothetical protein